MKRKIIICISILLLSIVFAVIGIDVYSAIANRTIIGEDLYDEFDIGKEIGGSKDSEEILSINVYEVSKKSIENSVKTSGKITSFNIENIDLSHGEKIKGIYVTEGQKVTKSQKIMLINDGYSNKEIKSSLDGIFFIIDNESSNEYKIYDTSSVGLTVPISENEIPNISIDQRAIVKIIALNREVEGKVIHISKLPNSSGKFNVKIKINYEDDIYFGYTASVKIETSSNTEKITIPYECLNVDEDGKYYVVEEQYMEEFKINKVQQEHRIYVEVDSFDVDYVGISSGIDEGMRILSWK